MKNTDIYDLEKEFRDEVKPLLDLVHKKCMKYMQNWKDGF